jgi:hypothetical protein
VLGLIITRGARFFSQKTPYLERKMIEELEKIIFSHNFSSPQLQVELVTEVNDYIESIARRMAKNEDDISWYTVSTFLPKRIKDYNLPSIFRKNICGVLMACVRLNLLFNEDYLPGRDITYVVTKKRTPIPEEKFRAHRGFEVTPEVMKNRKWLKNFPNFDLVRCIRINDEIKDVSVDEVAKAEFYIQLAEENLDTYLSGMKIKSHFLEKYEQQLNASSSGS